MSWFARWKFKGETATKMSARIARQIVPRNVYFFLYGILLVIAFWVPLSTLARFCFQYEYYSHIPLIPVASGVLIYLDRRKIFLKVDNRFGLGTILLAVGVGLYWLAERLSSLVNQNDYLFLTTLAFITFCCAGFALCYGPQAFRAAAFPLLFLFLAVPIPSFLLETTILILQKGSAEGVYILFKITGVPVFREDLVFSLPGVNIEVARECSGIRSSLALLITTVLAAYLFLRSPSRKFLLILATFPLVIVKNSLRIVTLSLLAVYVDRSFLSGSLHRYGGILFFTVTLAVVALVLRFLKESEKKA